MKNFIKLLLVILILSVIAVTLLELTSTYTPSTNIHQNAPVKIQQSVTINAPIEKVYAIFTNVDEWPKWQKDITAAKLNGTLHPGSTIDWKTGGLSIHSTLHTVLPNKCIGWSGKAFGAFAIHTWRFEQHGDVTTITVNESMEGWLVKLFKGYFQEHLGPATQNWLQYLKNEAENN
jgi:uncharacterized membrane protein